MCDWTLSSNHHIDSYEVGDYIAYLVVRVRSVERLVTVPRRNNAKDEKLSFFVDNAEPRREGREKIIECLLHDAAARKYAPLIKKNMIIYIRDARVQKKTSSLGNTPFCLRIFANSEIVVMKGPDDNDEVVIGNSNPPCPGTSRARDTEVGSSSFGGGQPLASSYRNKRKHTGAFLAAVEEDLLKLDESKRRKFELDILGRLHAAMRD